MSYKVAVVGATGNVGREMLSVLAERAFPTREVVALASSRSVGTDISFGDAILKIKALDHYDFKGTDIVPDVGRIQSRQGMVAEDRGRKAPSSSTIPRAGAWTATCRLSCRK